MQDDARGRATKLALWAESLQIVKKGKLVESFPVRRTKTIKPWKKVCWITPWQEPKFFQASSSSTTWYGDFWCPAVGFLRFERTHFHPDRLNLLECKCEWTRNIPVSETKYQQDNVGGARRIWFTTAVQLSASVMHGSWKRAQAKKPWHWLQGKGREKRKKQKPQ